MAPLPRLIDRAGLRRELGVSRAMADAIMREVPTVRVPGVRRELARAEDVERALEEWTCVPEGRARAVPDLRSRLREAAG